MEKLFKRLITTLIVFGSILILCQIILVFVGNILSIDNMFTTTATTLLASTNHEIVHNINTELDRMTDVANKVESDDSFQAYNPGASTGSAQSYDSSGSELNEELVKLRAAGSYADCGIIYGDGHSLGVFDNETLDTFGDSLYSFFSDVANNTDESLHFTTGYEIDFSHLYYTKRINSNGVFVISMLRENFDTLFYDAEENASLTLRLVSAYDGLLYSSLPDEELGSSLDQELSQAVSSSDHLAMVLRGQVIASDICDNQWRIISTIDTDDLTGTNSSVRNAYIVVSVTLIIIGIICVTLLVILISRTTKKLALIEDNLENYTNLDDINID